MQLESLDDLLLTHLEALEGPSIGPASGLEPKVYDAHAHLIQAMSNQRDLLQGILAKLKPLHDVLDEEGGEAGTRIDAVTWLRSGSLDEPLEDQRGCLPGRQSEVRRRVAVGGTLNARAVSEPT